MKSIAGLVSEETCEIQSVRLPRNPELPLTVEIYHLLAGSLVFRYIMSAA
jgi:hypothetical protein